MKNMKAISEIQMLHNSEQGAWNEFQPYEVNKMKKYKIYDLYEGKETIGYADTISEMKKIGREYYNDTDGECALVYATLDEDMQKYKFFERKNLTL